MIPHRAVLFQPERSELSSKSAVLRSGRADSRPERVDSGLRGLGRDNMRSERADCLKGLFGCLKRPICRPEGPDSGLRGPDSGLRGSRA